MCGIAGISFAPGSEINRRKTASVFLTLAETRGTDAAGYGFVSPTTDGVYKKNVPGAQLHVGGIPTDATALILHTRMATTGDPRDNENNHPVISSSGNIRLVHNGVIYNHQEVRTSLGKLGKGLPDVDTAVMPQIIDILGVDGSDQLAGYAAAAWFDRETNDTIHLARFKQSTVSFAYLFDGSLAFASTPEILGRSLNKLGIGFWGSYPTIFDSMAEGDYYQILGGEIIGESEVEWKARYAYSGPDYSAQTSGAQSRYGTGSYPPATYVGGTTSGAATTTVKPSDLATSKVAGPKALTIINHGTGEVRDDETPLTQREAVAMVFSNRNDRDMTEEDYERWVLGLSLSDDNNDPGWISDPDMPDVDEFFLRGADNVDLFYLESHDGDYTTYTNLGTLVQKLSWESGIISGENNLVGPEEGNLRWVNQIADAGALGSDGSETYSWVRSDGDFQTVAHLVPSWVADGLSKLRTLVGA